MKIGPLNITLGRRMTRRYDAARLSNLTADWVFNHNKADREIAGGLPVIRARVRDLERNNDWARAYLGLVERNVVGRGFALRVEGPMPAMCEVIRKAFLDWADEGEISGRLPWADAQRLVVRSAARDGESVARLYRGPGYKDGLGFQIVESDLIAENITQDYGSYYVTMGVECTPGGKPLAYHVHRKHPDGGMAMGTAATERIPADDLVHVARIERPGQTRAVSWMVSSLTSLRMLGGYMEAELVASRVSASKMGFFKTLPGENFASDDKSQNVTDVTPGQFETLTGGTDFIPYDPQHPTTQFPVFVKAVLRQLASGLGVAYNNFANDLDSVNFSSIRSGTIEEREAWMVIQDWFARSFCDRIFRAWLPMAATSGTVPGLGINQLADYRAHWTGRRWPWVDPQSDITAKKMEIELGLACRSQIAAEQGNDFATLTKQNAADEAMLKAIRPELVATEKSAAPIPAAKPEEKPEEKPEGTDGSM